MGHLIHSTDIRKLFIHTSPTTPSAICPKQCKRDSPMRRTPLETEPNIIQCDHLPSQISYDSELDSGQDLNEDDEHADELHPLFKHLYGWLVSDDLGRDHAGCGGPWLVWIDMVCGCEAVWTCCQILSFGDSLWWSNEHSAHKQQLWWKFLLPASQLHTPKTYNILGIVLRNTTEHFREAFTCGKSEAHLCNNHTVIWHTCEGGWVISTEEKCSGSQIFEKIFERNGLCVCVWKKKCFRF